MVQCNRCTRASSVTTTAVAHSKSNAQISDTKNKPAIVFCRERNWKSRRKLP